MIRRQARLRKEYIYRKSVQNEEREKLDRAVKIREALQAGTPISQKMLQQEAHAEVYGFDEKEKEAITKKRKMEVALDDEYANAGIEPPKILITSSHNPSARLTKFVKELKLLIPNAQRLNRGTMDLKGIVDACRTNHFTDLIIVHEHRGEPDGLIVSHLPYGPTAYFGLSNCVLRHDVGEKLNMSEAAPHLIFHNFKTKLGERLATILKYLFPVPKEDTKRVITFANDNDFISFRHHVYKRNGKKIELLELGPRFEMKLYQVKLGTVEMEHAQNEWVLRPYMNTARKRQALGAAKDELEADEEK
eukprot:GEZU01015288.1.p1 GENE.GEZU01015288.1~~GEZU01015288.1.p1  ORF type:complete len:323 (+),score=78.01 GEZU01015288.1:55-969(+)